MKQAFCVLAAVTASALMAGCDWSGGGGEDFNSSRGGANINISGYFRGQIGGRAVSNTSGGPIGAFTIQQSGNAIEIIDSNGSTYRGTVGSPAAIAQPNGDGVIPSGVAVSNFQVSWAGRDGTAARDIEFSGIITLVAVQDIRGDTTTRTITDNGTSTQTSNTSQNNSTSQTSQQQGNNGTEDVTNESSSEVTDDNTDEQSDNTTRVITRTFSITGNNTQMLLEGSWIEQGGKVARVQALSAGAAGGITTGN